MKPIEILGLLFGVGGIVVLDLGLAGSAITDLFYVPPTIANVVPPNIGSGLLGSLMPGGNTTLFLIGVPLLAIGMIFLIDYNYTMAKSSMNAMHAKK